MQNFKSEDLTNFDRVDGEARNLASIGHAVNYPNTIIHTDTLHLLDDISSLDNLKEAFKKGQSKQRCSGY